mgnify:CR=1 FL=1
MALYKTEGVVLNHRELGETDKILTLFTLEKGKLHAVARGVRRPRNPLIAGTLIFSRSNFLIVEGKNLDILVQSEIIDSHSKLRSDLKRMAYGAYFSELIRISTPERNKNEKLYNFFLKMLHFLEEYEELEILARCFEIKLLSIQGYTPQLTQCVTCGANKSMQFYLSSLFGGLICENCKEKDKNSKKLSRESISFLLALLYSPIEKTQFLKIDYSFLKEIEEALTSFIEDIFDKKIRTYKFLDAVRNLKA